ncbi:AraC family ligand binding domain-containing protein [uncultured Polaribacter sp.]|uniref:AraC family ligand binding domain-containing protein n=1 Tax=uncultured Polaribacter sp. TaxID=174711 RepID=UPI0026237A3B|nr:AraC family ligand binding domain-containing protein [uncultured Polaribacter sp.]
MNVTSFLENIEFKDNKPAVSILMETDFSKEIRIVFKKGQVMKDHKAPFTIIVQVIKGSIDFGIKEELLLLNEGDLISLESNVLHNLKAKEESVVRLTLSKLDSVKRVESV